MRNVCRAFVLFSPKLNSLGISTGQASAQALPAHAFVIHKSGTDLQGNIVIAFLPRNLLCFSKRIEGYIATVLYPFIVHLQPRSSEGRASGSNLLKLCNPSAKERCLFYNDDLETGLSSLNCWLSGR